LPSHYLDLEVTHTNHHIIKTTSSILAGNAATKLSTIYDAGGDGAEMKLAKRKLTQLGVVKSHCGVVNSAELLAKMEASHQVVESIASISRLTTEATATKKQKEIGELAEILPAAKEKLAAKKGLVSALYKTEIRALLVVCYSIHPDVAKDSLSKPTLVSILVEIMESNPDAVLVAAPAP
jgi:hypothetical protein